MVLLPALALATALVATPAQAQDLCPDGPIRFAHYEFGLLYTPENGGIDDDIQRELARRSGCRFEVSLQPRARIWKELENGELHMAGSGIQTPARDRFAWFAHYVVERNQVLLSPRVPAEVHSMDDFVQRSALHLGAVRSFSHSPYLDAQVERLRSQGRLYEVSDVRTLYRMADFGRYDAFIASPFLSRYYLQKLKLPEPSRVESWDQGSGSPSGLVLSKKHFSPEQARAWQGLIQDMLADGTVKRIVQRHLGPDAEGAVYSSKPAHTR